MQYLNIKPVLMMALLPILAVWPAVSARADETFAPPALKRGLICRHFTNFQEFAEYAPELNGVDEDLLISWLAEYGFRGLVGGWTRRKIRVSGDDFEKYPLKRYDDLRDYGISFRPGIPCGWSSFRVNWLPDGQGRITDIQTDMVFRHFDGP